MKPLLEARGLQLRPHPSLSHIVDFRLKAGEVLHVVGPSGVGKTTLLRRLARLRADQGGELLLDGRASLEIDAPAWRRQVAFLPQRPAMLPGSVHENLAATGSARRFRQALDQPRARRLLAALDLDADRLLAQDARLLSGGEAARVALVRALLTDPRVLLLDEPTASLDAESAQSLVDLVAAELGAGRGVVLVAHDAASWRAGLDGGTFRQLELVAPPVAAATPQGDATTQGEGARA